VLTMPDGAHGKVKLDHQPLPVMPAELMTLFDTQSEVR